MPLQELPAEIREKILLFADDFAVSVKLECLWMNLPTLRPDPESAFDDLDISLFASSPKLASIHFPINDMSHLHHYPNSPSQAFSVPDMSFAVISWFIHYIPESRIGSSRHYQYAHEHLNEQFTSLTMDTAARSGQLKVVKFLHDNRHEGCTVAAMNGASGGGHIEVVRFLHFNREEGCSTKAMDLAAWNGHLKVVIFLNENRREGCTGQAVHWAASKGHTEVLKYLWKDGVKLGVRDAFDERAAKSAMALGIWSSSEMVSSTVILASVIASIAIVNATPTSPPKCDNFYCKLVPSPDGPTCGSDGQQYMNGCIFEAANAKTLRSSKLRAPTTIIPKTSTVTVTTSTAISTSTITTSAAASTSSCTTTSKKPVTTTSCTSSVTTTTLPKTITSVKPTMTNIIESGAAAAGGFSGQTALVVLAISIFALF
ncbi:hypothetical protein BC829DRAFT_441292 [Chytridium lagenaria]|nr:hypothetical protein BC829DRAFT_441292 [Chytridium lagenaria]